MIETVPTAPSGAMTMLDGKKKIAKAVKRRSRGASVRFATSRVRTSLV